MTPSRQRQLLAGQTALARKVYDAIPIAEAWSVSQIICELARVGVRHDKRVLEGCLSCLAGSGLVTKGGGTYRRVSVNERVPAPTVPEEEEVTMPAAASSMPPSKQPANAITHLSNLASRATELATQLRDLADDIEAAAIEVDEQFKMNGEDLQKLKQLQGLLKSLGGQ